MYFPEAFDHLSLHRIEAFYPPEKRVIIREADAVCFACNAINVGRNLILNKIGNRLSSQLEQLGFKVIQVELTEFLKAGGAAKCLVMKLSKNSN
jgi:ornithine--oxo-acid transaminase